MRRKYFGPLESDEEKIEFDNEQYRLVRHSTKSKLEIFCNNIRDNADLTGLNTIYFNNLSREEQNIVEESIYTMMARFKTTPLELDNSMPKELSSIVENKWHYYLNMEKEIRESTLGHVMLELTKGQIKKENKKHGRNFLPKYRAFKILQNQIEDVV